MDTTGLDLVATIRSLAELDAEGQLPQLQQQWASECRGTPRDSAQLFHANQLLHVQTVSRALAVLFDLPYAECEAAVRNTLLPHPRRDAALNLINQFLGRDQLALDKLQRERLQRRPR